MAKRLDPNRDFYTTAQLAREMGVTPPTVIKWIRQGRISASLTPGGHRRIPASELRRLLAGGNQTDGQAIAQVRSKPRILILDPELDFGDTVAEYLALQGGFESRAAVDPIEIGFLIGNFGPNIVLCSMDLPSFGSIVDHSRQINAQIVVLASSPNRNLLPGRDELVGCTIVGKPVQLEALLRVIQSLKVNLTRREEY